MTKTEKIRIEEAKNFVKEAKKLLDSVEREEREKAKKVAKTFGDSYPSECEANASDVYAAISYLDEADMYIDDILDRNFS